MRHWTSSVAAALVGVALLASLSGCGGASTSGGANACDEPSVTETLHHILGESRMELVAVDDLQCSGEWSWVRAKVAGPSASDTEGGTETPMSVDYIFQRDGDILILKSAETVCGTFAAGAVRPPDALLPQDLWSLACTTP